MSVGGESGRLLNASKWGTRSEGVMLAPIAQGAGGILISMRYLFCTLLIIGSALAVSAQTTEEEVTKLLGQPSLTSSADHGERLVYEFDRGEGRVLIAEFVGNSLVSSRLETRS